MSGREYQDARIDPNGPTVGMTTNAMSNALRPLFKFAFNGLANLALVAAVGKELVSFCCNTLIINM